MIFRDTVRDFKIAGYGVSKPIDLADGSKQICLQADGFSYKDQWLMSSDSRSFAGNELANGFGQTWMMGYMGRILVPSLSEEEIERVYSFVREALRNPIDEFPFRGPTHMKKEDLVYKNKWEGDFSDFNSGVESVFLDDELVFQLTYHGGFSHLLLHLS